MAPRWRPTLQPFAISRKRCPRAGPAITLRMYRLGTGAGAAGRAAGPARGTPPEGVGELRGAVPEWLAAGGGRAAGDGPVTEGALGAAGFRAWAADLPQVFPQASHCIAPAALRTSQDGQTTPS